MYNFILMKISFWRICPIFILLLQFLLCKESIGQVSNRNITPYSYSKNLHENNIPIRSFILDAPTITSLKEKGKKNEEVGIVMPFSVSLQKEGLWENVEGQGSICRIRIQVPNAEGFTLFYQNFDLPSGAYFHIYDLTKKHLLGGYTSKNNTPQKKFNTEIIEGTDCILEYYEPFSVEQHNVFEITEIGFIYKSVKNATDFGQSSSCHVNINCSEGDAFRKQQKAVCRILIKENGGLKWCTGSLVGNTKNDCTPYVLTAFHCAAKAKLEDYAAWIFYYQYEGLTCINPITEPISKTITGATLRAHSKDGGDSSSDFILCEINQKIPTMYDVTFNGWRKTNISSPSGAAIHHPFGDIKKISTYKFPLTSSSFGGVIGNTHWQVIWGSTPNGHSVTQEGSSGSPLYDVNGLLIGTLTGGAATCTDKNLPEFFGKFSEHYTPSGATKSSERLIDWLDMGLSGTASIGLISVNDCPFVSAVEEVISSTVNFKILDNTMVISAGEFIKQVELVSLQGQILETVKSNNLSVILDISGLSKGPYFVNLQFTNVRIGKKIMIE